MNEKKNSRFHYLIEYKIHLFSFFSFCPPLISACFLYYFEPNTEISKPKSMENNSYYKDQPPNSSNVKSKMIHAEKNLGIQ